MTTVFDFDKTLTDYDTLLGFYLELEDRKTFIFFKRLVLFFFAVAYKLKIISNTSLKKIGFQLFIKGHSKSFIINRARKYAKTIQLNKIYSEDYLRLKDGIVFIISASYLDYLEPLFPDAKILATGIRYTDKGLATQLTRNMFGPEKRTALAEHGVLLIDCLYTDSYSDKSLMDISKSVFMVVSGKKVLLNV